MYEAGAIGDQLRLQLVAVFLERLEFSRTVRLALQQVQRGQDVVRERVAIGFRQGRARPRLRRLQLLVHILETGDELTLLLFEHLDIAFGIDLVGRLFSLAVPSQ